ncbi:MAG: NUDIX hydrolase [Thermoleophilia bacterium]|nr:NUDIX hydrolase [Thermoleophilia bacterium]
MSDAEVLERRAVYQGKIVDLTVDTVRLPNRKTCDLEMIRHPGAAAVVPVDRDGNVLLVRQYRYATDGWLLEVPAGKLDHKGESPEACAIREVEEETGFKPGSMIAMGWIWTTPGFSDEKIWLFLARNLTPAKQSLGRDEVLTVERLPVRRAIEMAAKGEIVDAKSICSLLRTPHFLNA